MKDHNMKAHNVSIFFIFIFLASYQVTLSQNSAKQNLNLTIGHPDSISVESKLKIAIAYEEDYKISNALDWYYRTYLSTPDNYSCTKAYGDFFGGNLKEKLALKITDVIKQIDHDVVDKYLTADAIIIKVRMKYRDQIIKKLVVKYYDNIDNEFRRVPVNKQGIVDFLINRNDYKESMMFKYKICYDQLYDMDEKLPNEKYIYIDLKSINYMINLLNNCKSFVSNKFFEILANDYPSSFIEIKTDLKSLANEELCFIVDRKGRLIIFEEKNELFVRNIFTNEISDRENAYNKYKFADKKFFKVNLPLNTEEKINIINDLFNNYKQKLFSDLRIYLDDYDGIERIQPLDHVNEQKLVLTYKNPMHIVLFENIQDIYYRDINTGDFFKDVNKNKKLDKLDKIFLKMTKFK